MGALAETIKAAESKVSVDLSKTLDLLQREAETPVGEQSMAALQAAGVPTAREESKRRLYKGVLGVGAGALAFGALLRLLRSAGESTRRKELLTDIDTAAGRPGREVTIPIPDKRKQASEKSAAAWPWLLGTAALAPSAVQALGESAGSAWRKTKETTGKGFEHLFEPTGSALTNPWTAPLGLMASIAALYGGYKLTDKLLAKLQERRREKELARAQSAFEHALSQQFTEKPGSIIGAAVDGVAQAYVDGELEKQAQTVTPPTGTEDDSWWQKLRGGGGAALGGYLALLTLLASLGAAGGYHWIKKYETPRRKYEAAKELLLRRQLAAPPTVSVDTGE